MLELFQMLQAFQKHKELIKRPAISKELQSERETLLAKLLDYVKGGDYIFSGGYTLVK